MGRLEELKSRFSEEDLCLQSFNWKTSIKMFSKNKKPVRHIKYPVITLNNWQLSSPIALRYVLSQKTKVCGGLLYTMFLQSSFHEDHAISHCLDSVYQNLQYPPFSSLKNLQNECRLLNVGYINCLRNYPIFLFHYTKNYMQTYNSIYHKDSIFVEKMLSHTLNLYIFW